MTTSTTTGYDAQTGEYVAVVDGIAARHAHPDVAREQAIIARDAHRAEMAKHLTKVADDLAAMLRYWEAEHLPGDFLTGPAYPFAMSLDEVEAQVRAAAEHLGES